MGTAQMEGWTNLYKFIRPFMDTTNYTLTFFPDIDYFFNKWLAYQKYLYTFAEDINRKI